MQQNFDYAIKQVTLEFEKILTLVNKRKNFLINQIKQKYKEIELKYISTKSALFKEKEVFEEIEGIRKDLNEEFQKHEQIGFLEAYKKIVCLISNHQKNITDYQTTIKFVEEAKFINNNQIEKEKKLISESLFENRSRPLTPNINKQQSQNQNLNFLSPNNYSYQKAKSKNVKKSNKGNLSSVSKNTSIKIKTKLSTLQQLQRSFNKAARLAKNSKPKKKQNQKKNDNKDIQSHFDLSILQSEKMSMRTTVNNHFLNQNIVFPTQQFSLKQELGMEQQGKWFKRRKSTSVNQTSLSLSQNDNIKRDMIFMGNFNKIQKNSNKQLITDRILSPNHECNMLELQKSFSKSKFHHDLIKFSHNPQTGKQQKLFLIVGGSNEQKSKINFTYYNPQTNKWLNSPSKQSIDLNKFFSCYDYKNFNKIILFGGKKEGQRTNEIKKISIFDRNNIHTEKIVAYLNLPKSGFSCVQLKNKIYIAGGNDGNQIVNDLQEISLKNFIHKNKKQMKHDRDELSLCLNKQNSCFYAIGGYSGKEQRCLNEVEKYDIENDQWINIASLNTPRRALSSILLQSGIFAIGGFDGEKYLSSVEYYNETVNKWFVVSFMNNPRCLFASIPSEDGCGIFVFGGFNEKPLDTVEFMHLEDSKWIMKEKMNQSVCMHFALNFSIENKQLISNYVFNNEQQKFFGSLQQSFFGFYRQRLRKFKKYFYFKISSNMINKI